MISAKKFEILSAYLDDEVSQEERLLVERWIECDPLFRQQYQAQLALKAALRSLPANLFEVAITPENRLDSCLTNPEQTTSKRAPSEQSAYPESPDALKLDRLSSHKANPIDKTGNSLSIGDILIRQDCKAKIGCNPMNINGTAIASKWKNLLIIATALSAAVFTTLSCGSIKSSQKSQIRRPPGRITEVDAPL